MAEQSDVMSDSLFSVSVAHGKAGAIELAAAANSGLTRCVFRDSTDHEKADAANLIKRKKEMSHPPGIFLSSCSGQMQTNEDMILSRPQHQANSFFVSNRSAGSSRERDGAGESVFSQPLSQPLRGALLWASNKIYPRDNMAMDVDDGGVPLRIAQLRRESLTEAYPMVSSRRRFHKKRRVGSRMGVHHAGTSF